MAGSAPLKPIAELIERSVSIRHVYGDPVAHGDTTVIPVAEVVFAFGGGGGVAHARPHAAAEGEEKQPAASGSGGGGAVRMRPLGVLEIAPEGTRFVRYRPLAPLVAAAAAGLFVGMLLGRLRR
jgi:uncharacterized spore protein YtfJ